MTITSQSVVVPLKAISMGDLQAILEETLRAENYRVKLESKSDSELLLRVSRLRYQTLLDLQRYRHRPLEVVAQVDFKKAGRPTGAVRSKTKNGQSSNSIFSYRWIWLLLFFGGAIITAINILGQLLDQFLTGIHVSQSQAVGALILVLLVVPLVMIVILPKVQQRQDRSYRDRDRDLLALVESRLNQLQQELLGSEIIRCWSCFKEIEFEDRVCPFCGVTQKQ